MAGAKLARVRLPLAAAIIGVVIGVDGGVDGAMGLLYGHDRDQDRRGCDEIGNGAWKVG